MTGTRARSRRLGAILATALFSLALLPGVATAGETRTLYVGDPARLTSGDNPYQIHPTLVSPGQVTYFDVLIKNGGKQTLTSATVGMGTLIATLGASADFGKALPAGWKIKNVVAVSGITPTCTTAGPTSTPPTSGLITSGSYDGLSCNFGNLAKQTGGTIRIFLTAGSALAASSDLQISGKVAENVGGNVGSNSNTFYAVGNGTFFVSGPGILAGFFQTTGSAFSPNSHAAATDITSVDLAHLGDADYLVSIDEVSSGPACPTVVSTACSNAASNVHVNNGNLFSTYFVWTMLFPVDSSFKLTNKTGLIHFFDDYDATTNPNAYETFYNVQQTSCLIKRAKVPCADFSIFSDTSGQLYLQIVFRTNQNGSNKYF